MRLPPEPALEWTDGVPSACAFGDVYFSKRGGLAESETVFLGGCGLPEAWAGRDRFAIGELGFGTGVNVLAAWRAWRRARLPHAQLHISTIEAFPLAVADAARALSAFPDLSEFSEALIKRWPVRAYGPQRLWFPEDGFSLTIWIGEAERVLKSWNGPFDAWFLDGFAPARNPHMWTPDLFAELARLSVPGARVGTFTVAGDVRRGLEAAGFAVEKKPGFGAKRERLEARLIHKPATPTPIYPDRACHPKRVAVVGAGIAGAACAEALARRGVEAVVVDAGRQLGAGASGNPAGLVMPRLDRGGGPATEIFLAAYLAAIARYQAMGPDVFTPCGVEQRADAEDAALADLLADPLLPPDWFAAAVGGALHVKAGVLKPQAAIARMLAGVATVFEAPVQSIDPSGDGWVLRTPDGRALVKADAVVLACGGALARFAPAAFLPIALSRGQIEWGAGPTPEHALTHGAYVAPFDGGVLFGATFDAVSADADIDSPQQMSASRAENLTALKALAPDVAVGVDADALSSRASVRATTPDRMPIAGLLPDAPAWLERYAVLAHGGRAPTETPPPAHEGVYVLGGLGARGLTMAPLLGELIASQMCSEQPPLSRSACDALHPARFLHRALKRR